MVTTRPTSTSTVSQTSLPGSLDDRRTTFLETELCDVLEDELDGMDEDVQV
jgi:hypothetical protein